MEHKPCPQLFRVLPNFHKCFYKQVVKVVDRPTQTPLCGFAVAAHEPLKFSSDEHIFERFSFLV